MLVKLDTNGSRPKVVQGLIRSGLVDYISMDIKSDPFHYRPMITKACDPGQILESIRIIMESPVPYEFRTTCVKPIVNAQHIGNIARMIQGAMLYALQRFHKTEVLHPEFFNTEAPHYDEDELLYFKSIADPWVESCVLR